MFAHVPLALATQLALCGLGLAMGLPAVPGLWLGAVSAAAICVMREATQREYQWIEHHGDGHRENMPLLAGWKVWQWNRHSKAETITACLAVAAVAGIATMQLR